jgi:anti-sigma regulatory factor (Ser/Thr protein kinase)
MELNETQRGEVGIVVTELANNLIKHGGGGELILRSLEECPQQGIEALSLDKGPGIASVNRAMEDGYSTAGSPGTGLGAIRRLSHHFEIYSSPGKGAAILARVGPSSGPGARQKREIDVGAVNIPFAGETESGDSWAVYSEPGRELIVIADGLGHGVLAADASREAARIFTMNGHRRPSDILDATHLALRSSRGAAVAVAEIGLTTHEVRFAGIGNISGCLQTASDRKNMVSHNGTVGLQVRKVQEFTYSWTCETLLIMHSDGLATSWSLDLYPGLLGCHPALIAGVLYRDFKRGRDDVTVVVARETRRRLR